MTHNATAIKSPKTVGVIRILFGIIWLIDAQFKWRPSFINDFASFLTGALDNQPALIKGWISLWIDVVNVNPVAFAYFVALAETALALALILGLFSNLAYLGGAILAFVIWSTAEGFGGPYIASSTDIGAAVIYIFVFVLLWQTRAGLFLGLDGRLGEKLGPLAGLASGRAQD
jgi:uncharacterized membrane protein YphA (DoxX/SURF4 family)